MDKIPFDENNAEEGYRAVLACYEKGKIVNCKQCAFNSLNVCHEKKCIPSERPDGKSVIFVKKDD